MNKYETSKWEIQFKRFENIVNTLSTVEKNRTSQAALHR